MSLSFDSIDIVSKIIHKAQQADIEALRWLQDNKLLTVETVQDGVNSTVRSSLDPAVQLMLAKYQ